MWYDTEAKELHFVIPVTPKIESANDNVPSATRQPNGGNHNRGLVAGDSFSVTISNLVVMTSNWISAKMPWVAQLVGRPVNLPKDPCITRLRSNWRLCVESTSDF